MKQTKAIMGMPITIEIVGTPKNIQHSFNKAFDFFYYTDEIFSTYKDDSIITKLNKGLMTFADAPADVHNVLHACQEVQELTGGYFNIQTQNNGIDPSGYVKGWSIAKVADILDVFGIKNYYVDAGGDIVAKGFNGQGRLWRIGIRHPKIHDKMAKVLRVTDLAVATSGTYERGNHIYNPLNGKPALALQSVTVAGPDMITADVYATALFAAGDNFRDLIKTLPKGYDVFVINNQDQTLFTPGFESLVAS